MPNSTVSAAGLPPFSRRATLAELCNLLETIDLLETSAAPVVTALFLLARARELASKLAAEEDAE